MKKIVFIVCLLNTFIFANLDVVVSILPEETFVKAIGKEHVNVSLMVRPGNSPHTYEPKPSQMKSIAHATLYFAIGVEFEKVWLPKFQALNPTMQIVDLSKGIRKLPMQNHHHDKMIHALDPHIWTSPLNVKKMAQHIYETLMQVDPSHKDAYRENYLKFIEEVEKTHLEIQSLLSKHTERKTFMVFHPSWGYYAKVYGLRQLPVEIEGKSPKPKQLIALIQKAKEAHISAIFTQPEFSDQSATLLAEALNIPVIKVSPLAKAWAKNLLKITHAIAGE